MPAFRWTATRLSRLRSAVRAYNRAITMREHELGDSELKRFLPKRVTVDEIRSRISSVNDFRRIVGYRNDAKHGRTSELTRILKSVNRNALDFTRSDNGVIITNYDNYELHINRIRITRYRNKTLRDMTNPLFDGDYVFNPDEMSEVEYSNFIDNTDLDSEGEVDDSIEDISPEIKDLWEREDARNKAESLELDTMYSLYLNTWEDSSNLHDSMPGYETLIYAMDWLKKHNPAVINKAFNSGYDELTIPWIIPSDQKNPYVNTPYEVRHMRAVSKWVELATRAGADADEFAY